MPDRNDPAAPLCLTTDVAQTRLLGVRLDLLGLQETMARIGEACEGRRAPIQIVTVNLNFLTLARKSTALRAVINGAGLVTVDGRILLWLTRLLGRPAPEQITGHDLFRDGIALAAQHNYRVFLLGAGPGVAAEVARRLQHDFPGLQVMGTDHGAFDAEGRAERPEALIAQIRDFAPHMLFVSLGCPKQELWIAANLPTLSVPMAVGVGCVLDVAGGKMRRAPRWMQLAGLESLFQLLTAPRRYARRYLRDDPPTLVRALGEILARRLGLPPPA